MDYGKIVRDIAKAVIENCKRNNLVITEEFCVYYVKLLKLDPNLGVEDDRAYRQSDYDNFVKYVAWSLENDGPKIKAIRMQFFLEHVITDLYKFAIDRRMILAKQLEPLRSLILKDISESSNLDRRWEDVVQYLTLASGLGNPKNPQVHKEVETVVRSVIDRSELVKLLESEMCIREVKLDILVEVVAGIRLFNYSCKKGGQGISNLIMLLRNSLRVIKRRISSVVSKNKNQRDVSMLSTILESCYKAKKAKNRIVLDCHIPDYATESDLEYVKLLLTLYNQFFKSMKKLLEEVDVLETQLATTEDSYKRLLNFLNRKIKNDEFVSASRFFPIFAQLYEWWSCLQDEVVTLTTIKILFNEHFYLMKTTDLRNSIITNFPDETFESGMCLENCLAHAELLHTVGFKEGVKLYRKESFVDFEEVKLEYTGYCSWKLVATSGVLSMGDPEHGILEYQDKYYIFCCFIGLISFGRDPDYYVLRVLALARKRCELIVLLSLRDQMALYRHKKRIMEKPVQRDLRIESMNTDFFLSIGEFDKNYEWNVWEMRRKALQMAKLKHRKTSSMQTVKSNFKTTVGVQTYASKEQSVQTVFNSSTNTPKPSRYIFGLRGKRDSRPYCLDLTKWDDLNFCKNKTIQ